jgi:porin
MLYQVAADSPSESEAASGLVRVYGQWEPFRCCCTNNPGMLVFKGENRHRMGSAITPFDLGFEAGSIVPTGTFFSEFNFGATNLFWKQYFLDCRLAIAVGRIDVTDFVDVYAMLNPLTHFINLAFSTNPTIVVPNQGLGAAVGGMVTDRFYTQAGFGDANGQPTLAGFDTFFEDSEYFSYIEFGVTPSQDRIYLDNIHVTLWHSDARETAGTAEGHGVAFTV